MTKDKRLPGPGDDEQAFLAAYDAAQYPHPSVAVDVALLTADEGRLRAVLTQRSEHPAKGQWSLPGGFVGMDESLDAAAARVLKTKLGLGGIFLEQLYTFGQPDRDPRTRVISVAYYALVDAARLRPLTPGPSPTRGEGSHSKLQLASLRVPWPGEQGGPAHALDEDGKKLPLAFDHAEILGLVVQRLRGKLDYAPIGFELLPREFTLRQLQTIHETILGRTHNKDSFRRRLLASGLIAPTGKLEEAVDHRPAELYRFARPGRKSRKSTSPPTSRKE
jgi:8-oxo-dGTP diphosphatase